MCITKFTAQIEKYKILNMMNFVLKKLRQIQTCLSDIYTQKFYTIRQKMIKNA